MAENKLQPHSTYIDGQLVTLGGPDNTNLLYQYDQQQRMFYLRESLIAATNRHGVTHVGQDLVPGASCDSPGLMSATDKCKLDELVGTRLGVLGFQGAGFPDDGGWLQGDVLLASGSEFISLERVGNVIRFVVDVPTPFTCSSEECFQVYWIQDETEANAIRPPSCAGTLSGVNAYGELKVYLFPESTVINPNATANTLNQKGNYPSLIFKRYDDGTTSVNEAELDMVLKRNTNGTAVVGWAFTPGATGTPECRWFMGLDDDGNRREFKLEPNDEPGLFGAILYKSHSITKQMGIITGYQTDALSTNQYKAKFWSITDAAVVGDEFTVTNLQQWDLDDNLIVLDSSFGSIMNVGQFIDVWTVNCGGSAVTNCYYCKEQPILNVNGLWATLGALEFGTTIESRPEDDLSPTTTVNDINDVPLIDPYEWGVTNLDDPMYVFVPSAGATDTDVDQVIPASGQANYTFQVVTTPGNAAVPDRRYLQVDEDDTEVGSVVNIQRPVFLWHRASLRNALIEVHFARPVAAASGVLFPPIDVLLRAPVSTVDSKYSTIVDRGTFNSGPFNGQNWVKLGNLDWHDLPPHGAFKVIMLDGSYPYGQTFNYTAKLIDDSADFVYVVTSDPTPAQFSIVEFLHEEYTTPAARLQFRHNFNGHDIEMTGTVGTLDMGTEYNLESSSPTSLSDNFVQDFVDFEDSATYWQDGSAETSTSGLTTSDEDFYILNGGVIAQDSVGAGLEYFNVLKIMVNEAQVWMWWNNLLIPPDSSNPYFTIDDVVRYGKFGLRLWPGALVRRVIVRSKLHQFSQFSLGQLELS